MADFSQLPDPPVLPDADAVYLRFFDRWLKPSDRERRGFVAARPDLLELAPLRGVAAVELSPLAEERRTKVADQVARMVVAARSDWKQLCAPFDVLTHEGLAALDAAFDPPAVLELIRSSDPADFGNSLLVTTCELGAVLGEALRAARPTLQWVADWPYWESTLVDRPTGCVIAPFHWAIRKLSADGAAGGLIERIGFLLTHLLARTRELA